MGFCPKDRASFGEAVHVFWSNINDSLSFKTTYFVQNMSQATETLENWKRKNGQVNFKYPVNIIFKV